MAMTFATSDQREDLKLANQLIKLGIYFHNLSQHILQRAPTVILDFPAPGTLDETFSDEDAYAKAFDAQVSSKDDNLQTFTKAILGSFLLHNGQAPGSKGEDKSRFLLLDPETLIGTALTYQDKSIYGFALYLLAPKCNRLVFFGAGTRGSTKKILDEFQTPNFDWQSFSKSYAAYRSA